jgi:alkanesulfonate monooxygenase SsuD/methylene tetrahydromethanopterin reductase-like flavin-dependent oxidoreductase (luciferase family)
MCWNANSLNVLVVQIGFLADLRNPLAWERPSSRHYGKVLELAEEADRLGAGAIFLGEHHLTEDGYIPQPLIFAAAVAARTKRIRVGPGVLIAPFRHPLHIAEEAAIVDVLSGGRLELGLGAGYVPREFEAFGVDRASRFRALDHAVVEVRRLLSDVVTPRPVQERVPIWCGYIGAGARRAGLLGEGLLSMQPAYLQPYLEGLAAGGHDPASARMAGLVNVVVSTDPERVVARIQPHVEHHSTTYAKYREEAEVWEGRDPAPAVSVMLSIEYKVMTPEDAVSFIRTITDGLPVAYVIPWLSIGGMPDDVVEEHVTLTASQVAPALA